LHQVFQFHFPAFLLSLLTKIGNEESRNLGRGIEDDAFHRQWHGGKVQQQANPVRVTGSISEKVML